MATKKRKATTKKAVKKHAAAKSVGPLRGFSVTAQHSFFASNWNDHDKNCFGCVTMSVYAHSKAEALTKFKEMMQHRLGAALMFAPVFEYSNSR